MTNILTLKIPLSSVTETLLLQINQICSAQGIPYFIAGATAREILIHHVYGRAVGRRTRDIDFAVFVQEWQLFDNLKQALTAAGAKTIKGNAHRLVLEGNELDIIPFGGVAEANKVAWPPDREVVMAVDGFEEAFGHTVSITMQAGEQIPFCSLPGLALLKLFAWRDRGMANGKDAVDLYKIINEYGQIENERAFENSAECDKRDWDVDRMGALLLGKDIAMISTPDSIVELFKLDADALTDAIVRQTMTDNTDAIEERVLDFWTGLHSE
ncbi:nucleotidyl transferase AbiEii/AbiGii toxin family protein [Rahnella bonaserana]|jgi:predicted nucleotidyltransferase|uniref:Nucleotidyl transferase AbiEii/AbiGii toxin family protein n=1 Tax=Rahnella bonaserana TaxID=2816248 RepID=A0ABS6LQV9_9GAMM|nr:nucleotidyl transferase AbiEii/AbiGii toxin family protein [Rahnella bonaserana]MBU9854346.1 nucleotidyl transferase AbiEii/AbiGii toxin family protein [Rahnella bonaserana]